MISEFRDEGIWRAVHNGVPTDQYLFSARHDEPPYLAFLGRLTPTKGAHVAIRVARESGLRLVIGGNIGSAQGDSEYFQREVRPHLDDDRIKWLGEVDDAAKGPLLGGALALLCPVLWDEPFGIVAAEALACGTPVIAFEKGELPYIVRHGITGFLCRSEEEMVHAVRKSAGLSRSTCRLEAEQRFSARAMTDQFEELYNWLLRADRRRSLQCSGPSTSPGREVSDVSSEAATRYD
jgi:glycosyltransferase involved in cell wall biosynthesis